LVLLEVFLRSTPTAWRSVPTAENQTVAGLMGINVVARDRHHLRDRLGARRGGRLSSCSPGTSPG